MTKANLSFVLLFASLATAIRRHSSDLRSDADVRSESAHYSRAAGASSSKNIRRRLESDEKEIIPRDILGPLLEQQ